MTYTIMVSMAGKLQSKQLKTSTRNHRSYTCQWESPVAYPDDGKMYDWDETTTNWTEIE